MPLLVCYFFLLIIIILITFFEWSGIYSGIVAEAPDRKMNRGRFLIFFDDGYAMYCDVNMVYLVYSPPANVWDDISYRYGPIDVQHRKI